MKNIFVIFMLFFTVTVSGQSSLVGVKGGVGWTGQTSHFFVTDENFRTGLAIGLTYDCTLKKHFSIGIDVIYNQRGFSTKTMFSDNLGNTAISQETLLFNYDYITFPLKIGFNYGETIYVFGNMGLIPSVLVHAVTTDSIRIWPEFGGITSNANKTTNVTNIVNKFDIGGFVEIGGGYKFKEKYWLYSSFIYQHSFTPFTNKNYFNGSKIRHYGMILSLGLKININQ